MRPPSLLLAGLFLATPEVLPAQPGMTPEAVISARACDEYGPRVAYNALREEYLVVWYENCGAGTPAIRVLARFLDRDGLPRGATFEVAPTADGRNRYNPDVVYDRIWDRYLVVYQYEYATDSTDFDIRGRIVPAAGVDPAWGEFVITQEPFAEWDPVVTYSWTSQKYLVSWIQSAPGAGHEVWGALYAIGLAPTRFAIGTPTLRWRPAAAFEPSGNAFIVTYDDDAQAFIRWIAVPTGSVSAETGVSGALSSSHLSAVASCGAGQGLATWDWFYDPDWDLSARFLQGGALDGDPVTIANTTADEVASGVACLDAGSSYLVIWMQGYTDGTWGTSAREVTTTKAVGPAFPVRAPLVSELGLTLDPAVAGGRHGWLVVWRHQRQGPPANLDIYGRVVWELFAEGFERGSTDLWSARTP